MHLEITTIYNAAYSNYIYKSKLDSYKNEKETKNLNGCPEFTNEHLNSESNKQKICEAVILFLKHFKEESDDTTYYDIGCKYLFYWLYTHVKSNEKAFINTLNLYKQLYSIYNEKHNGLGIFNEYIDVMNEHTIDKLVKLTDMYNILDNFYERNTSQETEENCTSGVKDLYTKYLDECRNGYDYDFCDELKNFRKKHNYFIQNIKKCKGVKYLLPPVEKSDTVGTTIIPFSLITVTSLILPIIYKFTAFGPWIRRIIGKNKNILEYINEDTNHSLNTYEIRDDSSNMPNYNIAYNSS
ncbi:PIR Superfamily Protein [Plasmodium ovale curtisi]|uniref:PIR Superfamily Protein n=1 Tax=Plasmodium ovale curtisi TaxID=864141 RepID=A0A1A8WRA9_PLAOA|nr:PIR Superfamily Protein [Plasmodium ovale curtisi]